MSTIAEFSERFSELIGDESFTKVGERIGLSKQTVSAYANGERNPKKPTIQAIALHYGINPAWLIGLDAPKYLVVPTPTVGYSVSDNAMAVAEAYDKALPKDQRAVRAILTLDEESTPKLAIVARSGVTVKPTREARSDVLKQLTAKIQDEADKENEQF